MSPELKFRGATCSPVPPPMECMHDIHILGAFTTRSILTLNHKCGFDASILLFTGPTTRAPVTDTTNMSLNIVIVILSVIVAVVTVLLLALLVVLVCTCVVLCVVIRQRASNHVDLLGEKGMYFCK